MWRGIAPILGPDDARFSLLYVDDLAEAVMRWLACENIVQHVFELHDGKANGYGWDTVSETIARLRGGPVCRVKIPRSFLALIAMINSRAAQVVGYAPMLTPGKVRELRHPNWVCDNTLLTRETGWVPHIRLEEGLRRTLEAYGKYNRI
jgi:nucleoside-diphosphate-sugar epimerase